MKLGIGLPNTLAWALDRRLLLDWARLADDAGFHVLGTIDKPNYDSRDPLITLAGAAGATERIRLATAILQLPPRNEMLVAKQAAALDRLSDGRLDLGVAVGGRRDDFAVLDADEEFGRRGRRLEEQVARIRRIWADARASDEAAGVLGPAPVQEPGPPIWIGAVVERAIERALRIADGFVLGALGVAKLAEQAPALRARAAALGKPEFQLVGTAYVAIGERRRARELGVHSLLRYYGDRLWAPPEDVLHFGPVEELREVVAGYAAAGLDQLILFSEIAELAQVERIAEAILPDYL